MSFQQGALLEPLHDINSLSSDGNNTNTVTASTASAVSPREGQQGISPRFPIPMHPQAQVSPIINWTSVYDNQRKRHITNPFMTVLPIKSLNPQPNAYNCPHFKFRSFCQNNPTFSGVSNNNGCLSIFGHIPESPMPFQLFARRNFICDPTQKYGVYSCYTPPLPAVNVMPMPPSVSTTARTIIAPAPPIYVPPLPLLERLPPALYTGTNQHSMASITPSAHECESSISTQLQRSRLQTHAAELLPLKTDILNGDKVPNKDKGIRVTIGAATKKKKAKVIKCNKRLNQVVKDKAFKCVVCGKSFRNKSGLSNHKIIHNQSKPHKCTFKGCNKAFGRSCDLTRHLRLHTGQKPFKCTTCGKAFTRSVQLRLHVMDHTGKRPYHCSICKKGFKTLQNKQIHMRIHTGEKPYECDFCHKKFTQSSSLRTHMSSIHN